MIKNRLFIPFSLLLAAVLAPASTLLYQQRPGQRSSEPHGLSVTLPPAQFVDAGEPPAGYVNEWSIDAGDGSSDSLTLTDANFGDYDTNVWGLSFWMKQSTDDPGSRGIWAHDGFDGSYDSPIRVNFDFVGAANKLRVRTVATGTTVDGELATTAQFTDTNNFIHVYIKFDLGAGAGDELQLWTNGIRVTAFSTETMPTAAVRSSAQNVWIGRMRVSSSSFLGPLDEVAFFSGSLPDVTDLRDATTGKPKDLTGLAGLYSWVPSSQTNFQRDVVKAINWTPAGAITNSTDVP